MKRDRSAREVAATQCEDILDRWEISSGRPIDARRLTEEDEGRAALAAIEPALRGCVLRG